MKKKDIKLQSSIFLTDPMLHKEVIAEYIKKAEEFGCTSVYFCWNPNGSSTQVSFTINL